MPWPVRLAGRSMNMRRWRGGRPKKGITLDDDMRLGGGQQAFRLAFGNPRDDDFLGERTVGSERLAFGRFLPRHDLDILLATEIVDDCLDRLRCRGREQ